MTKTCFRRDDVVRVKATGKTGKVLWTAPALCGLEPTVTIDSQKEFLNFSDVELVERPKPEVEQIWTWLNAKQLDLVQRALLNQAAELFGEEYHLANGLVRRLVNTVLEYKSEERQNYVSAAQASTACREGELEVDDDAAISKSSDGGAYVQAWLWVPNKEEDEDAEGT